MKLYMFDDDAKLFNIIRDDEDKNILQEMLNKLKYWCDDNSVVLNIDKCVTMRIGSKNENIFDYHINNNILKKVDMFKDLGVSYDDNLKFDTYINEMVNKCFSNLGLIGAHFKGLSKLSFLTLYNAMVRSKLDYASSVWSPWQLGQIELIEKVQKRATKMLNECNGMTYIERLKYLNMTTLKFRRIRGDLIILYNICSQESNKSYPTFKIIEDSRTRGHNKRLIRPNFKLNLRKYFFNCRVVPIWNSLPMEVVNARCVNEFKNKFDKLCVNQECRYDWRLDYPC